MVGLYMWARWKDTSRATFGSRTLYTTGDNCEQTTDGPRHDSSSFGLGPSESWYGLYTSTSCPGWNTGYDLVFAVTSCLFVCALGRVSACELKSELRIVPRVLCEFFGICCSSFLRNAEERRELYRRGVEVVYVPKKGVSRIVALKLVCASWTNGKRASCFGQPHYAGPACCAWSIRLVKLNFLGADTVSFRVLCIRVSVATGILPYLRIRRLDLSARSLARRK